MQNLEYYYCKVYRTPYIESISFLYMRSAMS